MEKEGKKPSQWTELQDMHCIINCSLNKQGLKVQMDISSEQRLLDKLDNHRLEGDKMGDLVK